MMKKCKILIVLMALSLIGYGQRSNFERVNITAYEKLVSDSLLELKGETFDLDTSNISDGQTLIRVLGKWKNTDFTGGFDSLTFDYDTGYLYDWRGGSRHDSTSFDERYLKLTDTIYYVQYSDSNTVFATPVQLSDSLDIIRENMITNSPVFSIVLPASGSVEGRIATPTSLPDGWTLTSDGINLLITHNLGRWSANVTVKAQMSDDSWQQQINTAKYSYYSDTDSNQIKIYSLCTATKPIRISIIFE